MKAQLHWVDHVVGNWVTEDGRLPQAGHWCTEHWVSTKGVQRQSEGIPWTVQHSQSWMQHTTPGERTFETLKNRGCTI